MHLQVMNILFIIGLVLFFFKQPSSANDISRSSSNSNLNDEDKATSSDSSKTRLENTNKEESPNRNISELEPIFTHVDEGEKINLPDEPPVSANENKFSRISEQLPVPLNRTDFDLAEELLGLSRGERNAINSDEVREQIPHREPTDTSHTSDEGSAIHYSKKPSSSISNEGMDLDAYLQPLHQYGEKRKRPSSTTRTKNDNSDQDRTTSRKRRPAGIRKYLNKRIRSRSVNTIKNQNAAKNSQNRLSGADNIFPRAGIIVLDKDGGDEGEDMTKHPQSASSTVPTLEMNQQQDEFEWVARMWVKELRSISSPEEIICAKKAIYEVLFEAQLGCLNRNSLDFLRTTWPHTNTDITSGPIRISTQPEDFELTQQMWVRELRNVTDPTQVLFAKKAVNDVLFEAQMGTLHKISALISRTMSKSR